MLFNSYLCSLILICQFFIGSSYTPLVITTWGAEGFRLATESAYNNIKNGRMYSLVEGLSTCEREQCDGTVGFGGSPDENGDVYLDAMLIDGQGHKISAVAHLPNIKSAARVAWAVMNYTKHTMLVGEAAKTFALQMGFQEEMLRTNESDLIYRKWKSNNCQPNYWKNVMPDPVKFCGPYKGVSVFNNLIESKRREIDNWNHDTIGMVVIDENNIAAGTSTNGASHKIPGRVGDSPIVGAGAFAVEKIGGAAATGDGDIMMRFLPSYQAVEFMRNGMKPGAAARRSLARILEYYPDFQGAIVVANMDGKYGAACANLPRFDFHVGYKGSVKLNRVACLKNLNVEEKRENLEKNIVS